MAKQKATTETPQETTPKAPEKSPGFKLKPNKFLLIAVVVLVFVGLWATGKKKRLGSDDHSKSSLSKVEGPPAVPVDQQFKKMLTNRGKTLGLGPAAVSYTTKGLTVVKPDDVKGLNEILDGQDVDALIQLLKKDEISGVLVDPSIGRRNPIPANTVKNRLALGRTVGSLSGKLMSRDLYYYRMDDPPPELPEKYKKGLIDAARAGFGGQELTIPGDMPAVVHSNIWTLILTVRPILSSHLSYHTTTENNPFEAAYNAGRKARSYYEARESFQNKYGAVDDALNSKLTLELEVVYDEGDFIGPKDSDSIWRFVEPGIHGVRMNIGGKLHFMPPWYSVAADYRTVESLLDRVAERLAHQSRDYWRQDDTIIERFRTVHWREKSPKGPIEDLYRFSPRVPTNEDVTRDNMVKTLRGLGDWIADNVKPDGRYVYRYFPVKDGENDEYNMVRHCLGPFSMALTEEFSPDPKHKQAGDLGMTYIEKHIRWGGAPRKADGTIDTSQKTWMGKPLPGPEVAIIEFPEPPKNDWSSKMGAVAVSILGYTQYKRVGWELPPEREKVLKGLLNFMLYMYNEDKKDFHHYYVAPDSHYYGTRNSIYPGEILYAVARLYGETKDERFRKLFKESMDSNLAWFKGELAKRLPDGTFEEEQRKNLVQFQPWIAMAMDEMYRYDPDPAYVEASNFVSLWIIDEFQFDETRAPYPDYLGGYMKVMDELPAMHSFVYTEGTAASYDLAKRANASPEVIEKLRKGALLTARFIMQQQSRPGENDFFYPNPKKAAGGVRYCMNHNKQRIDYTYHALSSVYHILSASTDEDYDYIHKIPMPKAW